MASSVPSESADSELSCSICLGTFVCPSTLSCGHSFCLKCLEAAWETAGSFRCPQCREAFPERPRLKRNVALANLVEQLRGREMMASTVACDICSDGRTPAVKTCVKCEISYCVKHLMPHMENAKFKEHVLVAPIVNLEERRCREHKQELILYCEKDESLVCAVCSMAGKHKGHEVIPVETAKQTKQEAVKRETTGREEKRKTAASRTRQLKSAYKRVEESLRGVKEGISREFERRRQQLTEEEIEALGRVDEEGRSVLSRIQANIDHYESRARDLELEVDQLMAALTVQDALSFLQDPVHETLRSSVSQDDPAPILSGLNLAKVILVGGVQTKLLPFLHGRSPTLDTNSAHDELQISSDLRTVKLTGVSQRRPDHPHRFDCWEQALCCESFSSGRHYLEMDVSAARWCRIGVAYGTIARKGDGAECLLGENDVSWSLQKWDGRWSVHHGGVGTPVPVPGSPRRVGVHLDWDAGLLAFYSADSMTLLHTVHETFTRPLYPGLVVGTLGGSVSIVDLSRAS